MSYESDLRARLLHGADRRRRVERRRTRVLVATPMVIALLVGAWWLGGRSDEGSDVSTTSGLTAEAAAACDALLSYREASSVLVEDLINEALERFVHFAEASGEPDFLDLAARNPRFGDLQDGDIEANQRAINRCRDLHAPGFVTTVVPAALGPEPAVPLSNYGAVQELVPTTDTTDLPMDLRPVARNLSPIRLARASTGEFIATYSYDTLGGRTTCVSFGNGASTSQQCGDAPAVGEQLVVPLSGGTGKFAVVVGRGVSFVVFDHDGATLVQRPVDGIAITATDPVDAAATTVRAYNRDGQELGCTRLGRREPGALSC